MSLRAHNGPDLATPEADVGVLPAMPRAEMREAAAPAITAVEKFLLVIIVIVILMVWRINGHQKAVRAECRSGKASEILYVSERHMIERADQI